MAREPEEGQAKDIKMKYNGFLREQPGKERRTTGDIGRKILKLLSHSGKQTWTEMTMMRMMIVK